MANPAAQARAEAQQWANGATVFARSRRGIKHKHPAADRFLLKAGIGPMHYGLFEDQEIDTAWQPTAGAFQYEMTTNDWQTYARDTFNAGDIFRFEQDGEWVQFDPQSLNWIDENTSRQQIAIKQAVSAQVNDDILSFPNGYGTGIHFQYANRPGLLQKLITIDNFAAINTTLPAGNEIWFEAEFTIAHSNGVEVYLDGNLWQKQNNVRIQTANRIEFRDEATGTQIFWYLDFARAWDSSLTADENLVFGEIEVRRDRGPSNLFLTIRIPRTWFLTATFPVFVDPIITPSITASSDDAWEDGDGTMDLTGNGVQINQDTRWGGFRFLDSPPKDATINSATLTVTEANAGADNFHFNVYGEDNDSAGTFTTTNGDITGRTTTTAVTAVDEDDVASPYAIGVVSIIEELVARSTWAEDNPIAFLADGRVPTNASVISINKGTGQEAVMSIDYTPAAGGPAAIMTPNKGYW